MDHEKGINANLQPFCPARAYGEIRYSSGNCIYYSPASGGGSRFDYVHHQRTLRLNDLVGKGWTFYPANSGFRVQFRRDGQTLAQPEIHFSIVSSEGVPGLSTEELSIFAALHEVGHAILHETLYQTLREEGHYFGEEGHYFGADDSYTQQLVETLGYFSRQNRDFRKYDERFAWRFALALRTQHELFPTTSQEDLDRFYLRQLGSYGADFLNPRWDQFQGNVDPWENVKRRFRF